MQIVLFLANRKANLVDFIGNQLQTRQTTGQSCENQ